MPSPAKGKKAGAKSNAAAEKAEELSAQQPAQQRVLQTRSHKAGLLVRVFRLFPSIQFAPVEHQL